MNPLVLDDYNMQLIGRVTGELGEDVELVSTAITKNLILQPDIAFTNRSRPRYDLQ